MSLKRLTNDEHATYLLGLAVRTQIEEGSRDPDTLRHYEAVAKWVEHWLDNWQICIILQQMGFSPYDFDDYQDLKKRHASPMPPPFISPEVLSELGSESTPRDPDISLRSSEDDDDDIPF